MSERIKGKLGKSQDNSDLSHKMNKGLLGTLIGLGTIVILGGAWAVLTKTGVIPNRFDIEALCNNKTEQVVPLGPNPMIYNRDGEFKPIIYLYPTQETKINVTLGKPENLFHTYPKYNREKGWNVIAQPNGDLEDIDTGRKLYALYREGVNDNVSTFNEGFVVKGEDTIPFLEEKLPILGLNEREAEEFIVYWLPQMENNERNLIRFESIEEQNENMPLTITPVPDKVIRVMMDWEAINEPITIPEQQLTTPERNGFTVVEWGGSPRN